MTLTSRGDSRSDGTLIWRANRAQANICAIPGSAHVLSALQRFALRTERGRLRPAWRLVYRLAARAYATWLRGGDRRLSVYLLGGREPAFGRSDIDLAVIAADAAPVLARRERLRRLFPTLCEVVLDSPLVVSPSELERGASPPIYSSTPQRRHLAEKPGLYGSFSGWQRLSGPHHVLPERARDAQERRAAAWLELRARWRWFLQALGQPSGPGWADMCVKAVADPARIWIWLAHGERTDGRRGTLRRALELMPDEERALRAALALDGSLASAVPGDEFAGHFVRLSSRVASALTSEVASAGATAVRLAGDELVVEHNCTFRLEPLVPDHAATPLLPLVDWRALVGAWLCMPSDPPPAPPDEALAPLPLDPRSLRDLTLAVACGHRGPYPALRSGELLVLASPGWARTQLRAVQSPLTDPVSFALIAGRSVAAFPEVPGWSASDWARQAVAENAPRLAGAQLPAVVRAARAALFSQSFEEEAPELRLTVLATLARLRDLTGAAVVDEAENAYRQLVVSGDQPPAATTAALRDLVAGLPAYRGSPAAARAADAGSRGS